jgi:hypothetical protein
MPFVAAWQSTRGRRSANGAVSDLAADRKDDGEGSHADSVDPDQSVMGNMQAVHVGHEVDPDLQVDTAKSVGDVNPKSTGWITR